MNELIKRDYSKGLLDKDVYLIILRLEGKFQLLLTYLENMPGLNEPGFDIDCYKNCDTQGTFLQQWTDVVASGDPRDKDFTTCFGILSKIQPAFIRCKNGAKEAFAYMPDLTVRAYSVFPDDNIPELHPIYSVMLTPEVEKLIVKDVLMETVPGLVRVPDPEGGGCRFTWMTFDRKGPEKEGYM
jgi:hypothetical protein